VGNSLRDEHNGLINSALAPLWKTQWALSAPQCTLETLGTGFGHLPRSDVLGEYTTGGTPGEWEAPGLREALAAAKHRTTSPGSVVRGVLRA